MHGVLKKFPVYVQLWSNVFFADAAFLPRGTVAQGSGPIFFSGLLCNGQESDLQDCSLYSNQPPTTFSSCQHSQDVAVRCTGKNLMVPFILNYISCSILSDIDECAEDNGGCNQTCTNSIGSYLCDCQSGYQLNQNRRGCDGEYFI